MTDLLPDSSLRDVGAAVTFEMYGDVILTRDVTERGLRAGTLARKDPEAPYGDSVCSLRNIRAALTQRQAGELPAVGQFQ